jgi:predicted MFS family arabinose efflux permease
MLSFGITTGIERMGLTVLLKEISLDLNLSLISIGTIWGLDPLAGFFVSLPAGLLADRFGVKRTLIVVCLGCGILSALRGVSVNFFSLGLTTFLFGIADAMIPTVTTKTTAVWFRGKQLGLANALLNISPFAFSMIATMLGATILSPLLGGWRNVTFIYGVPAVILGLVWWITAQDPVNNEVHQVTSSVIPMKQALSKVIRSKEVWIIGLIQMFFLSSNNGMVGYLSVYLRDIGWAPVNADSALTLMSATMMLGSIPMVLFANRTGSIKAVVGFSVLVFVASLISLPYVSGNSVFILLGVSGFIRSAVLPLTSVMIFQIKGIGTTYGGTAIGLGMSLGMLGAFVAPPLGNSFSNISLGMPFIFWGILAAVSLPLFFLIKNQPEPQVEAVKNPSDMGG